MGKGNGHATTEGEPMDWIRRHVNHKGEACLIWPFSRNPVNGYPRVHGSFSTVASRVMCKEAHGEPPTPKHEAAHSCNGGKDGCIHPEHLSWKTAKENAADKRLHGTQHVGEKANRAKLKNDEVRAIKALLRRGVKQQIIAEKYSTSAATVSRINTQTKWGEIV